MSKKLIAAAADSGDWGPELLFGLVSPIGTDNKEISEAIQDSLLGFSFRSKEIKLSELLTKFPSKFRLVEKPIDERYISYMDAGDKLRTDTKNGGALALLGLLRIQDYRQERNVSLSRQTPVSVSISTKLNITAAAGKKGVSKERVGKVESISNSQANLSDSPSFIPMHRQAFIMNSLKTKAEVETLKSIYRSEFVLIAGYSAKADRRRRLRDMIANSHRSSAIEKFENHADALISRDENDPANKFGQSVRKVYPLADLIVNTSKPLETKSAIERFLMLLFGYSFNTPTRDEYGMFMAHSGSLRSAALGRQVGAALTGQDGEIIAIGCNEVPKAFGGLYWEGDENDQRDFVWGYDVNDRMKRNLLENVLNALQQSDAMPPGLKFSVGQALKVVKEAVGGNDGDLLDFLLNSGKKELKETEVLDIMEFNRTVHAEMAALMDACKRGISVSGATLYVTTFPCHECTRHIIASGIKRVVYLDFYPKSRAEKLHWDSIVVESKDCGNKVTFEPFVGISPSRYQKLFTANDRKEDDSGNIKKMDKSKAIPRGWATPISAIHREQTQTQNFLERMRESKYF